MIAFDRPIKFEEVDAAGIVFFARYLNYAHEAMERFFGELEGGYAGLIMGRRVGFPAVEVKIAFTSPMRYGDVLRIETRVSQLGNRSTTFHYRMLHKETGALAAEIFHKVVVSDLVALKSCEMPAELRALLEAHQETPSPSPA